MADMTLIAGVKIFDGTAAAHARGLLVTTRAQSRRLTERAIESGTDGLALSCWSAAA